MNRNSLHPFLASCLWVFASLDATGAAPPTREEVLTETLQPYSGPTTPNVDAAQLTGKVLCGYQGWFNCEGDGADRGWIHWTKGRGPLEPGNAKIDLWPDVSELAADERFATGFHLANGQVAEVFSSARRATVLRHFAWMKAAGIDGVSVQRFISDLRDPRVLRHHNLVLANCREGANRTGRVYHVMYDLTGLGAGRMNEVLTDWHALRDRMQLPADPAYLHHRGKPLVALWGVGFNDARAYTLVEVQDLVAQLQSEGCAVLLGVPTGWREGHGDAVADPALRELLARADVISPWTVGRYGRASEVESHAAKFLQPDLAWCRDHHVDYLPVVFPGFSWHNMHGGPLNQIPRNQGAFLWSQFVAAKRAGATMIYVAMFDEVDEGTAIFKFAATPPSAVGDTAFLESEGLPGDFYLRLTGAGAKLLRGEIPLTEQLPKLP